jgi:hypothetical protein
MSEPLGPVMVGAREIYDQVVRTQGLVERLGDRIEDLNKDLIDHEARIRSLERNRWPLPSLSVLVSVAALLIAALPKLVH